MLCYVNIYHKNFLFGGLLKVIVLYCIVHIQCYIVPQSIDIPLEDSPWNGWLAITPAHRESISTVV